MQSNQLRERRIHLGFSQELVARSAGIARQSLQAMESNKRTPGVDIALKLAVALRTTVERLFGETPEARCIHAVPAVSARKGLQRVRLAQVDSSWFSYPPGFESALSSADGIVRADSTVELLRSERDLCENLVVMGCAPALSILVEHVARSDEPAGILWSNASSTTALQCLAGGRTHLAGAHLYDRRTASRNFADVKRITRGIPTTLITLAWWEVGLVVPKGNPLRIRRASDLARKTLRVALREEGSGARRLLDRQLGEAGVVLGPGPHIALDGHLEVARAVAAGTADVGVATQDAALSHHLTFIPLDEERYDLVIPTTRMTDPRVVRMLDTLATSSFRRDIASLGYRTSATGERAAS